MLIFILHGLIWIALSYDMHRHYGVKSEINADGV